MKAATILRSYLNGVNCLRVGASLRCPCIPAVRWAVQALPSATLDAMRQGSHLVPLGYRRRCPVHPLYIDSFTFDDTTINATGETALLTTSFTVKTTTK